MKVKNHFHSSSGILVTAFVLLLGLIFQSCSRNGSSKSDEYRIVFLHHSTGDVIWRGGNSPVDIKGVTLGGNYQVPEWFDDYNKKHAKSYQIDAKNFPNKAGCPSSGRCLPDWRRLRRWPCRCWPGC